MRQIAPSILSADFLRLGEAVDLLNEHADLVHVDVMDGTFVPNISFGFPVMAALARKAVRPLDVHLMIVHPEKYLRRFAEAGAGWISFHLEAAEEAGADPVALLREIRSYGVRAGLAIDPDVPVEQLFPYLEEADFVLVMTVFAGFGGQKLVPESYDRIAAVKAEIDRRNLRTMIEADGGIGAGNIGALEAAGASVFVAGASVFNAPDPVEAIRQLKECN